MIIKSTLNVNKSIMDKINEASEITGSSRNSIVIMLLKRAMVDYANLTRNNVRIKYQERDSLKMWHKFHVMYKEDVYEFCQDMRKFFKLSVSRILAFSVIKYLNIIINELIGGISQNYGDNYPYLGYIFIREEMKGGILWMHTWGIPEKIDKFLL